MNSFTYYQALAAKHARLSLEEELDLMRTVGSVEDTAERSRAIELLVMHNLDVALSEAWKRFGRNAEQLDEACAVAVVALFQSAKKADPAEGKLFRSFAYPKVKGQLWELRHRQGVVVESRYGKTMRRKHALEQNPDAGAELLDAPFHVVSLDAELDPDGSGSGHTLHDLVGSGDGSVRDRAEHDSLLEALEELPERNRRIVAARFGLGEESTGGMTLEAVGVKFNLTTERVRQIVAESITHLRDVMV